VASLQKNGTPDGGVASGWAKLPKETALAQLAKILESPHFRASKRCSRFLRFVVEHALDNQLDRLKERTLGIEVFDRDPQYDTNQDPIVRSTAGEVRKRLAQYYLEPEHEGELRIALPTGSYLPEAHSSPPPTLHVPDASPIMSARRKRLWIGSALVVLVAIAVAATFGFRKTDLERFWAPVISAPGPVLICIAQPKAYNFQRETQGALDLWFQHPDDKTPPAGIAAVPLSEFVPVWDRYTGLGDAQALSRLSSLFGANGKRIQVRGEKSASLADLRGKATVLIGAFDNQWTTNLGGELRFYFEVDDKDQAEVVRDRQNRDNDQWKVANAWPYWKIPADYAIVTRVVNATTEQTVVVAAGITHYGTQAAGEFVTNPEYFADALKNAPRDWSRKNMQVVISTKVLAGTVGPPVVLAVHFW
jgi:hypothetical protein